MSDLPDPSDSTPKNARSLRGAEFKRLLGSRKAWLWIGGIAVVLGIAAGRGAPALGLVYAGIVVLIGLVVLFWIAGSRARNRFWEVYAESRGLELGGRTQLAPATPFLRQGKDRYATRTLSGQIAPGIVGEIGLFTYEETVVGDDGTPETKYYKFTFGMAEVRECAAHMPELYVKRKVGLRALEKLEDAFRTGKRRVTLESEALADRYEIFVGKEQDEIWTRRLFSPSFIVWLTEVPLGKFGFELVDGTLVAFIPDHKEDIATLDRMAAATAAVAQRLLQESAETSPRRADEGEPSKA